MSARQKTSRIIQLVAAISVNGKIADASGSFEDFSSPEDQDWLHEKITEADLLVMGRKTYEKHLYMGEKPMILFSRQIKGLKHHPEDQRITWFNDDREEFMNLMNLLQYQKITVLGGSEIYHWFMDQKLATDWFLTVEPHVIAEGTSLLSGDILTDQKGWKLQSSQALNDQGSQLLHYSVV